MRNPIFDFLKSLAIVLVVLQHFMMRLGLGMEMMNVWPGKTDYDGQYAAFHLHFRMVRHIAS